MYKSFLCNVESNLFWFVLGAVVCCGMVKPSTAFGIPRASRSDIGGNKSLILLIYGLYYLAPSAVLRLDSKKMTHLLGW